MQISQSHRKAAAWAAIAYIAIQSFQWYAFSVMPAEGTPEASLLAGASTINLARAMTMLSAFFFLFYLFLITCATNVRRAPIASIAAFVGLFVFCLLEVVLRSIELFWVYLALPAKFAAADVAGRADILALHETFYAVQGAVYFPLGLVQLIASVLLAATLRGPWSVWARAAFAINALRLGLRMLDVYVIGPKFDAVYDVLYLPLVYVVFGGIAVWLWKGRETA
ncbi:hypothetical protein [Noviluteimonas gilva]|uniref:DUF4386 domain-containing protein n=1 Tax=Noviluteimonas gilva TaxID=2682097 RepID=A0A7C9M178_9GAMM|nr:hypothetical protein [Lysobacter gilvus]MUV12946.1 hypothetical protein [Lysobacter gilvus]